MIKTQSSSYNSGFYTGNSPLDKSIPRDAIISPSRNVIYNENNHLESFRGFAIEENAGGTTTFALENGWAALGSHQSSDFGSGNVIEYYNKSLIFVGTGLLRAKIPSVNSLVQNIGVASAIPQIAVLNPSGTGWMTPRQLGLAPQGISPLLSVPTSLGVGFGGKLKGVRSMKVSALRSTTGAVSIASPSSNVIEFNGTSAIVGMPPARTDGTDTWRLYFTPEGFGTVGGFYLQLPLEVLESELAAGSVNMTVGNVKIVSTGNARELEIEFTDQELLDIKAPIDLFPATDASFVAAIGNITLLIGTFKGIGISPSIPNEPESFSPKYASFMSDPVVGISRPVSGFIYIITQNSIWIAMVAGAVMGGSPVIARSFTDSVGIKNNRAATTIGDDLYLFSSGGKPVRVASGGQVDNKFGDRVAGIFKNWNPENVSVTSNEQGNLVIYSHGKTIMSYEIDNDRWNAPVEIDSVYGAINNPAEIIVSSYNQEGVAHLVTWNTAGYRIYSWNKGTTGSSWIARSSWDDWGNRRVTKDVIYCSGLLESNGAATVNNNFYIDFSSTAKFTHAVGLPAAGTHLIDKRGVKAYHGRVVSFDLRSDSSSIVEILAWDVDADIHNMNG